MKEKLLILGGTEFVGRQFVEKIMNDKSLEVYLFNRGKTNSNLFTDIKLIKGDRETNDVEQLREYKWDYVVDFSSYFPKSLKKTLEQINKDVKRYIYISTISVYDLKNYDSSFDINEDYEKISYSEEELIEKSLKHYGKKKAACEAVLLQSEWLNKTILRPSIIYGKYDPTDRFYYWLKEIKEKEKVILPDNGAHKLSLTFADDLVAIILSALRGKLKKEVYNCSTHPPMTIREMMEVVTEVLNTDCEFVDVATKALIEKRVRPPLSLGGNLMIDNSRLKEENDIRFTSFKESVQRTVNHYKLGNWKECSIKVDQAVLQKVLKEQ